MSETKTKVRKLVKARVDEIHNVQEVLNELSESQDALQACLVALEYAQAIINNYRAEIASAKWLSLIPASRSQEGTTLEERGFCQGRLFLTAEDNLERIIDSEGRDIPDIIKAMNATVYPPSLPDSKYKNRFCCSACGAPFDPMQDTGWRHTAPGWEHKCPGDSQSGHWPVVLTSWFNIEKKAREYPLP